MSMRHHLALTPDDIARLMDRKLISFAPPQPTPSGWQVTKSKAGPRQKRDMNNCQKIRAAMVKLRQFDNMELTEVSGCVHSTVRRVIQFHMKAGNVKVHEKMSGRPPATRAVYRWVGGEDSK